MKELLWTNIVEIHLFGMEVNSTFIYNKWICRTVGMRFENVFFWRCIALTRKAGVTCNHLFVIFMCILVWFVLFFSFLFIFSSFILWKFMHTHTPTNYMFLITFQARKTLQFFFFLFLLFLFFCFYCGRIRRFYPSNYFLLSDRIYQGNQKINIIYIHSIWLKMFWYVCFHCFDSMRFNLKY